jgi:hypothetical protein
MSDRRATSARQDDHGITQTMRTDLSAPIIAQAGDLDVNAARFRGHRRVSGLSPNDPGHEPL